MRLGRENVTIATLLYMSNYNKMPYIYKLIPAVTPELLRVFIQNVVFLFN